MSARRPHRLDISPTPAIPPAPRLLSRMDPPYPYQGGSAADDRMVTGGLAGVKGLRPMRVAGECGQEITQDSFIVFNNLLRQLLRFLTCERFLIRPQLLLIINCN